MYTVNDAVRGDELAMMRILIADEHAVVREGLRAHLLALPNCQIVAEAANGKDAICKAIETKPDVAVLAYALPLANGVEATRQIRLQLPRTEVLMFTAHNKEHQIDDFLKVGGRGCVLKSEPIRHLIEAIQSVAAHKPYFTPTVLPGAILEKSCGSASRLTYRERSVVQLVADGHTNKEIAKLYRPA
jgi:DNA-binding NarL/FixJ family response regulator